MGGMRFRKLRIAWLVGWGLLAVLLCVLWVRSYWWSDVVEVIRPTCDARADSASGGTTISVFVDAKRDVAAEWIRKSYRHNVAMRPPNAFWKFEIHATQHGLDASLPHWFYLLLTSLIATAVWINRFSLRTLLLVTTLVALALGAIVYAVK